MTVAGDNVFWTGDDPHGSDDCDRSNRDHYTDVRVNHGVIHRWRYIHCNVVMFNNKSNCFICHANLTFIQIKFVEKFLLWIKTVDVDPNQQCFSFIHQFFSSFCWKIWIWNVWKVWLNNFEKCEISPDCLPQIFANWNWRKYQIQERGENGCKSNFPILK